MVAIGFNKNNYYYQCDKPMYLNTECIEFEPRFQWTNFLNFLIL